MATLTLSVRVAWWVRPYLRILGVMCWLMGTNPDVEKLNRTINRGLSIRVA